MPPLPKDPSARARRNITPGAKKLVPNPKVKAPALPRGRKWRPETRSWWADLWKSPMAPELALRQDVHQLLVLAVLVDDFWTNPSKELAAEIRLQRRDFGLTVMARRSLAWEILDARPSEAPKARSSSPADNDGRHLRAVPDPYAALG